MYRVQTLYDTLVWLLIMSNLVCYKTWVKKMYVAVGGGGVDLPSTSGEGGI